MPSRLYNYSFYELFSFLYKPFYSFEGPNRHHPFTKIIRGFYRGIPGEKYDCQVYRENVVQPLLSPYAGRPADYKLNTFWISRNEQGILTAGKPAFLSYRKPDTSA
jgi:hypothetical protein